MLGERRGHVPDPVGTVGHRADPLLEGQLRDAGPQVGERHLEVGGVEERRVLVARPQDVLVADAHEVVVAVAVGHRDEVPHEGAVGGPHR